MCTAEKDTPTKRNNIMTADMIPHTRKKNCAFIIFRPGMKEAGFAGVKIINAAIVSTPKMKILSVAHTRNLNQSLLVPTK